MLVDSERAIGVQKTDWGADRIYLCKVHVKEGWSRWKRHESGNASSKSRGKSGRGTVS